jgi:hypothetical protein
LLLLKLTKYKSLLTIIVCLISFNSESKYYPYDNKNQKLSAASFNRYIIPQLRAISKEYYHLLVKLHPINKVLITLNAQGKSLVKNLNTFENSCQDMTPECDQKLKDVYKVSRSIDRTILEIQKYKITMNSADHLKDSGLSYMKLLAQLDQVGNSNYKLLHYLEEYRLTTNTNYSSYFSKKHVIKSLIHEILINTKMIMTGFLNKNIQSDFEAVWFQFISPIDKNIIEEKQKDFLLKRLDRLNMTWNTFHMKMTKGNHKMPKSITSIIKIMHNRWNSILKIILR